MEKNSHVRIFLDSIELPLKIGIYDHEREKPQRAIVDVALYADPKTYLRNVNPQNIIDYSIIYEEIRSWSARAHVNLIEDYLKELVDHCFRHELVVACKVSVKKADVFGESQGAAIEIYTTRTEWLD